MKQKLALFSLFISSFVFGVLLLQSVPAFAKAQNDDRVPGQYIVVFKDSVKDTDTATNDIESRHGGGHIATYHNALKGFAATLSATEANNIKNDSRVAYVTEDRVITIADNNNEENNNAESTRQSGNRTPTAQAQVTPTGVARVGVASTTQRGAGITVAVIDTGIDTSHPDLATNILNKGTSCIRRTTSQDDNGHGTHVAGIIAALDNGIGVVGVAPQAKLIPVKVLDRNGSGTWSSVICGIDWVTAHAAQYHIAVANMSLGGGGTSDNNCGNSNNDPLHQALCRSRDAGVTYVVAAGNSATDASTFVPAAYDDSVITVSALADSDGLPGGTGPATSYGPDDTFATFSNFGSVVDLGAPGVNIFSTWKGGAYATLSGTSMASPHVAGAAALYLNNHPGSTWTQIRDGLETLGESAGLGHSDPSGLHPEPVEKVSAL